MGGREQRGDARRAGAGREQRTVLYCVIPADLADKLHDLLRDHFAKDPGIEVIVERRSSERRRTDDRRTRAADPEATERRRLRSPSGRRIADRRAPTIPESGPPLPRRARRYAERLQFFQRVEPSTEELTDRDSARAVLAFQAGERDAFRMLYERYFDRVYGYLRAATGDRPLAEDLTQGVFESVFEGLERFEVRGPSAFRSWMFAIARNMALDALADRQRSRATEPSTMEGLRETGAASVVGGRACNGESEDPSAGGMLEWISDREVALLVERLPEAQRQVLVMRFLLGLSMGEIATRLGRSEDAVRQLQARAFRGVRERLGPARRGGGRRSSTRERIGALPVLAARRFAIAYGGRPLGGLARGGRSRADGRAVR